MKAVLIKEPGKIEIIEKDIPERKKGEALLKIKYCGICGSDLATYTGNQPFATYPRIPGHEFSAEIVDIDENNVGLRPGMLVTANPYFNCGKCYPCRKGKVNCCETNETMGVQRDGSFAEYITMPIERIYQGKTLSAKWLALIEPFTIGYHAIERGNVSEDDNVLVFGAGPIGIFAMISAKLRGAHVYVTDILDQRLRKALELGADGVINGKTENLEKTVYEITNGDLMDVCVEAAGKPATFLKCIENVSFAGKVILIGNGKKETTFNHSVLLKKELNVYGSRNSLNNFEDLIDLVAAKDVGLDNIVTNIFIVEKAVDAFESLRHNDGSIMKVLVKFD
ncbi:MAG: hypothetical protein PWP21_1305 [Thermosediminibacterales bacterium]|nr:hypothetical protein [Thermosediminibacterales bacterium]